MRGEKMKTEKAQEVGVWLSHDVLKIIDEARGELGLTRSEFIRYAIMKLLEGLSLVSTRVKRSGEGKNHE